MLLAATAAVAMLASGQAPESPFQRPDDAAVTASTERLREALKRPALQMPPPPDTIPTFRITVEAPFPFESVLDGVRRELARQPGRPIAAPFVGSTPLPGSGGGFSMDLVGPAIWAAFKTYEALRARADRNTIRDIQAEHEAFCAEHDCSVLEAGPEPPEGVILPRAGPR